MGRRTELEVENTLRDALKMVLGALPTSVSAVEVLSAYVFSLVKDLGLSESIHIDPEEHERLTLPQQVRPFIARYLPIDDDDLLRDALYAAFVAQARSSQAGKTLNRNRALGEREVLLIAQTAWNLERNDTRILLPIKPSAFADIPDNRSGKDFARMTWTERSNLKGVLGRSSGDSFRKQVARLAVLTATHLIDGQGDFTADLHEAELSLSEEGRRVIGWSNKEYSGTDSRALTPRAAPHSSADGTILVGSFAEVGSEYEMRGFDSTIDQSWADGGNRRIWLWGGPGLGKSYAARRIMQEALERRHDDRDELLIWVDSADKAAVVRALAHAAEKMPQLGINIPVEVTNRDEKLARSFLEALRTTQGRWLIVLDDARAEELIQQRLIPPGTNPNGRVLITTMESPRSDSAGRHITAEQFTSEEAEHFLSVRLPESSKVDRRLLATKTDHHPLVLAIAASTIVEERMTIGEWLAELETQQLEHVADHPDGGGYSQPIGATWRVALEKAAQGVNEGVVERAAMLAAVQDPAGHPWWLWTETAIREWVDGETPSGARQGRIHPGLKRLIDFGILRLQGDGDDRRISIHQMAARAVRESADPAALAKLGSIIARAWMLKLAENPMNPPLTDMTAGIRPLKILPGLDLFAQEAVEAMLEFAQSNLVSDPLDLTREIRAELTPLLSRGGIIGRAYLARGLTRFGRDLLTRGRDVEAENVFIEAYSTYERLVDDPSLDNELKVSIQEAMVELATKLGRPESAREFRRRAIQLREQLAESMIPSVENLLALVDLYRGLEEERHSNAVLDRALSVQGSRPPASGYRAASTHEELAQRLALNGRLSEATEHMLQAVKACVADELGSIHVLPRMQCVLGGLYARQGVWTKAERWLSRGEAAPILIASIQLRRGLEHEARLSLASAEKRAVALDIDRELRLKLKEGTIDLELMMSILEAANRNRWTEAADLSEQVLMRTRERADAQPGLDPSALARDYSFAGYYAFEAGRYAAAVEHQTAAVKIFELLAQLRPGQQEIREQLAWSLCWLADAHMGRQDTVTAIDAADRAFRLAKDSIPSEQRSSFEYLLPSVASVYSRAAAWESAIAVRQHHVNLVRVWTELNAVMTDFGSSLADALQTLASTYFSAERWGEALGTITECVEIRRVISEEDPDGLDNRRRKAEGHTLLSRIQIILEDTTEAESHGRDAATIFHALLDGAPAEIELQAAYARAQVWLGRVLHHAGRMEEATETLIAGMNRLQLPAELAPAKYGTEQVDLLRMFADSLRTGGRVAEAEMMYLQAIELEARIPDQKEE